MIYDGLISIDLRSTLGPALETTPADGLARLLFEGRWRRRRAECALSGAAVLAGCYRAIGGLAPTSLSLRGDADELLSLSVPPQRWGEAPPPWAERLPPAWTTEPCDFTLRARLAPPEASWGGTAIRAVLQLRYTPRHDPEVGALVGSLRALWTVSPPADEPEEEVGRSLAATFASDGALAGLASGLESWGEHLSRQLCQALEGALEGAHASQRGRVVTLWDTRAAPERFGEILAGFEPEDRLAMAAVLERMERSGRTWPALGPDGVEGKLRRGRFEAAAWGVNDAV